MLLFLAPSLALWDRAAVYIPIRFVIPVSARFLRIGILSAGWGTLFFFSVALALYKLFTKRYELFARVRGIAYNLAICVLITTTSRKLVSILRILRLSEPNSFNIYDTNLQQNCRQNTQKRQAKNPNNSPLLFYNRRRTTTRSLFLSARSAVYIAPQSRLLTLRPGASVPLSLRPALIFTRRVKRWWCSAKGRDRARESVN